MRILDETNDNSLKKVLLYLTQDEAEQMRDYMEHIINKPKDNHCHISSADYKKEVTICIYDVNDLGDFNERSHKLILDDE